MTLEQGLFFDVFNLIVAGLGLFGGIPVIMDWFTKPKIVISDVICRRRRYFDHVPIYNEYGEIDGVEEQPALTIISWRVKNEKKLLSSNRGILDLKTKYHFSRIDPDTTRDYQWSGETSTRALVACTNTRRFNMFLDFKSSSWYKFLWMYRKTHMNGWKS